jgi:hypothetical protein
MKISLKNLVGLHEEEVKDSDIPFLVKPDEDEEKNKLKQPVVPDVPSLVDVVCCKGDRSSRSIVSLYSTS